MQIDIKQIRETNAFSCLECGKCTGICPVSRYSNTFSPRQILNKSLYNNHPGAFKNADLWSCLTCQRCDEICPSDIKYIEFIQLIRQFVGINNREGTCSHGGILESISQIMTAKNLEQKRLDWMDNSYQTSSNSEYLYFMGCLPYFDVLFSEIGVKSLNIARSTLQILNYYDIKPQILTNEKCCGHDFYWNGDLNGFKNLAESNLEQIYNSGAKTIITACPECYRTLEVDYPRFFGTQPYQVMHISEFLMEKLNSEKIKVKSDGLKVTYQDPCRLGRHLGIYVAPRQVLQNLSGLEFQEMAHSGNRAICCGVSGWMNCSRVSKQIQEQRLQEAKITGADTLITSCPKCQIHLQCAMLDKQLNQEVDLQIKDLTEVLAENL